MWYTGLKIDKDKIHLGVRDISIGYNEPVLTFVFFRLGQSRSSRGSIVSLTPYKIYKIVTHSQNQLKVINDKGQLRMYPTTDFYKVPTDIMGYLDKESLRDTQIKRLLKDIQ
jgi:hypothetical protein